VKLIHSSNEDNKIVWGLTTLNNELYVAQEDGSTNSIAVYDTETYSFQRSLQVPGLGLVSDLTSCNRHQCIYIGDRKNNVVHRVENKNKITQWPVHDEPHGLSVNSVYNVLVTCWEVGKIKEFTTDGKFIREITLQSDIVHPKHTVELTTDQFVVCHGLNADQLNRVCIVNSAGCLLQSYGGIKGSGSGQLDGPVRLAVNGFILVADQNNGRVLMFSPTLSYIREVVSGLRNVVRLWFDERAGRLYVANNKCKKSKYTTGQFLVYSV
jgi:DNA-binding beta-propeller fold protein YncE